MKRISMVSVLFIQTLINFIGKNILDLLLIIGIASIAMGAFLTSITVGFYIAGVMLILFTLFFSKMDGRW